MPNTFLSSKILSAIGATRLPRHGTVTIADIRKFCVAVDDRNSLYLSKDAAAEAGYQDVIAPPLFPPAVTRPVPYMSELLDDGQYNDLAPPGLGHLQSILAGQEWEFYRPAIAGETISESVVIASIEEREGRSGPLVFVDEASTIIGAEGDTIMRGINTLSSGSLHRFRHSIQRIRHPVPCPFVAQRLSSIRRHL